MQDHLDREQLLDYLFEEGPTDQLDCYSAHLDVCLECRSRWFELCQQSRDVEDQINSATSEQFGRVVRELQKTPAIVQGLACVAGDAKVPRPVAEAARHTITEIREGLALVVRGLLDSGRRLAALAALQVPQGIQFEPHFAAAGIGSSETDVTAAGISLAQNDVENALETLTKISTRDSRIVESAEAQIKSEDLSRKIVLVSGRRQVILTWPVESKVEAPAAAVLVPLGSPRSPLVARFEQMEDEPLAVAQFDDVPEGVCDIVTLTI